MEKASGVNLEAKSGAGVLKTVRVVLPNSCDVAGASCIGPCLSIGLVQQHGEGGFAAWVTAYPPYYFTQALCSGEDTHTEHVTIVS